MNLPRTVVGVVQLAENPLDIIPGVVQRLLAREDGTTFGYGYGPDSSFMFGSEHGDVTVRPGQWVVRYSHGPAEVFDEAPCGCNNVGEPWSSELPCGGIERHSITYVKGEKVKKYTPPPWCEVHMQRWGHRRHCPIHRR